MVKKPTPNQKQRRQQPPNHVLGGLSFILAGLAIIVGFSIVALPAINHTLRKQRIVDIYRSIQYDGNLYFEEDNVFGDMRPYEYDKSRTYSSWKKFVVPMNVDEAVKTFDAAIKAAGFVYTSEPYPGSVVKQYHYKSDKGEYIRLTVSSKLRDDKGQNDILMNGDFSEEFFAIDPNAGPSNVTIKVNLDDNNE